MFYRTCRKKSVLQTTVRELKIYYIEWRRYEKYFWFSTMCETEIYIKVEDVVYYRYIIHIYIKRSDTAFKELG